MPNRMNRKEGIPGGVVGGIIGAILAAFGLPLGVTPTGMALFIAGGALVGGGLSWMNSGKRR